MAWTSAAAILSNYDEVLKTYYLPAIQEQLSHDTILADILDVNEEDVSGKNATIETHYGRTTGRGARNDVEALPTANRQKFKTMTVPMKYMYGRIAVTGPTIAATRDGRGAYARALDAEITGVVTDLQKEVNRMMWGAGWGVLCRWLSGVTTADMYVQKKYTGNAAGGNGFGSTFGAKYLKEGNLDVMAVEAAALTSADNGTFSLTGSGADLVVGTIVEGTDSDLIPLTTDPGTPIAGSFLARPLALGATQAADPLRKEMMGIRGIVTDEDIDNINLFDSDYSGASTNDPLQGLAVGTYGFWKAQVDAHPGGRYTAQRDLTFNLMQKMFDTVEIAAGKDYGPNLILTTHAIRREYLDLCQADRRYVNTMELDGGWTAIDYNGVPFTVDPDAIDGEIYFLTTKDLQVYRMSDYAWMQKDGSVLDRITGYDAYEAVLYRYAELGCNRRNSQGVLCDIAYES